MVFLTLERAMRLCTVANCSRYAKVHGRCLLHAKIKSNWEKAAPTMSIEMLTGVQPLNERRSKKNRWCSITECEQLARIDGLCTRHNMQLSSKKRKCVIVTCNSYARTRGLCTRHGGGNLCRFQGCKTSAQSGGLCRLHGGGPRCKHPKCDQFSKTVHLCPRFAKLDSKCLIHSIAPGRMSLDSILSAPAKRPRKLCSIDECQKLSRIDGLCTRHNMMYSSKRRKCSAEGCKSYARVRGLCARHSSLKV
ncbi:hypothetical protein THRCLA_04488 [Thraustotheca clavata]|uniref:WRKY transcription factor 19 n=1 Tax=Thraustotheca clavata TaxID=74557 RepID=A0A1V9ZZ42_9STRA|nr:hypothetical protein THRCLA_04488 [Thraustotheca clavata]